MIRPLVVLDLRRLFSARLRTVIAVIAVAAGSSLALSVVVVRSSVSASLAAFGHEVAGVAPLRIVGADTAGGLDEHVLGTVSRTRGVAVAVPVVQASTVVRTASGRDVNVVGLGLDCRAGALVGQAACPASEAADESTPAFDPPTLTSETLARRLGPSSWIETAGGALPLARSVPLKQLDGLNHGSAVVFGLARAQRLFDRTGRLDAVYVLPARSVAVPALQARLRAVVGDANAVLSAGEPPPALSVAVGAIIPLLTLLATFASGIAIMLVYNVLNLSLEQRRRERAIVAALGAPPALLAAGPLIEAAVVGVLGGALGAAVGGVLAGPTVRSMSSYSAQFVGVPVTVHTSVVVYLIGLVLGLAIAVVAAAGSLRRSARLDVAAELSGRDPRVDQQRNASLVPGAGFAVLAVAGLLGSWLAQRHGALAPWQPGAATLAFLVCVLASVLAVGFWAPVALRRVLHGGRWHGVTRLALANLVREPGRAGVVAVALATSVAVAFMTASFNVSAHDGIAQSLLRKSYRHSVSVATVADNNAFNADGRVPSATLEALRRTPGVRRVLPYHFALAGRGSDPLVGVQTLDDLASGPALVAGRAGQAAYRRGEVLVGTALARRLRLTPGSRFPLDTPHGHVLLTVQGVWEDGNLTGDNVTMSSSEFARLYGPQLPSGADLVAAPGVSLAALEARVRAEHLGPQLVFSTPRQVLADASSSVSAQLAPFWALQRALLLVSFVSVLSTLLLAGLQRRREFGLLSAVGLTPTDQLRMVVMEAVVVAVVAGIFGAAMGVIDMGSLIQVVPLRVGFRDPLRFDAASLLVYVPLAVVVAVIAALWPAWRARGLRVVEALQYE